MNAICPGWVRTDMGGASAPRSPEQGADTAIWLATEASRNETGKFWRDQPKAGTAWSRKARRCAIARQFLTNLLI